MKNKAGMIIKPKFIKEVVFFRYLYIFIIIPFIPVVPIVILLVPVIFQSFQEVFNNIYFAYLLFLPLYAGVYFLVFQVTKVLTLRSKKKIYKNTKYLIYENSIECFIEFFFTYTPTIYKEQITKVIFNISKVQKKYDVGNIIIHYTLRNIEYAMILNDIEDVQSTYNLLKKNFNIEVGS